MPTSTHASAIIHWRSEVEKNGGMSHFEQSATVTTMLFGCHRWLEFHAATADHDVVRSIEAIKNELEQWLADRGQRYAG